MAGIAGLLAFIPVFAPFCIPLALVAGGAAMAIDATFVATGNGDWTSLAIDGVARAAARPARQAAKALRAQARMVQPGVTRALKQVASEHGGKMVGLRNRLKIEKSLRRKIGRDMKSYGISADLGAGNMKDVLRYTMTLPRNSLTLGAQESLEALRRDGFGIERVKNYWVEANSYKGRGGRCTGSSRASTANGPTVIDFVSVPGRRPRRSVTDPGAPA